MPKWSLVTLLVLAESQNPSGNCGEKNIRGKFSSRDFSSSRELQIKAGMKIEVDRKINSHQKGI